MSAIKSYIFHCEIQNILKILVFNYTAAAVDRHCLSPSSVLAITPLRLTTIPPPFLKTGRLETTCLNIITFLQWLAFANQHIHALEETSTLIKDVDCS